MRYPALIAVSVLLAGQTVRAAEAWRPLWNGRDLAGWSTFLGKPQASTVVEGLAKDAKGNYTESIGAGRDPLGVFTVAKVDGQPAIRISG